MSLPEAVLGVLLAGGKSSRMGGGDKCLMPLAGAPMLSHVVGAPKAPGYGAHSQRQWRPCPLCGIRPAHRRGLPGRPRRTPCGHPCRAFNGPKPIDQKADLSSPRRRTRHSSPLIWWPGFYRVSWEVSQGCWLPDRKRACIRSLDCGPSSSGPNSKSRLRAACAKFKPGSASIKRKRFSSPRWRSAAAKSIPSLTSTARTTSRRPKQFCAWTPQRPPVFGIAGWKNSGKTTLATRLVSELTERGYAVTAIKHAHESFDIDQPGRDSYRLREAGARRVILSSPKRWALMHELGSSPELPFEDILSQTGPCDLVLVEGFKREALSENRDPQGGRNLATAAH